MIRNRVDGSLEAGKRQGLFFLKGAIGLSNARRLWKQGHEQLRGPEALEIDLSQVVRSDSAGVALLLAWAREAEARGQAIRFANIPDQMRAIATACGVAAILPFAETPDEPANENQESVKP